MKFNEIFKNSNDYNEKTIIGFMSFAVMTLAMIVDLVTGYFGNELKLNDADEESLGGEFEFNRDIVKDKFTQEWEMKHYYDLANQYGYRVFSIIVENRHDGVNEHGVPEDKIQIMKDRFEVKL